MNQLDYLKQYTTVVADTGDFKQMSQFQPQDATTNPSLILKAAQQAEYAPLLKKSIQRTGCKNISDTVDQLLVQFGCEILQHIPGRVSTEIDARLSFDTIATVTRAERIIELYQGQGIHIDRVLIKIAATWEGIEAARRLEQKGIHTNLTLLFSLCQAAMCAKAEVQIISPFVGRIYDWHKKHQGNQWDETAHAGLNDFGVQSVHNIYHYYKQHGITTEIMGASFRNTTQIMALTGCDFLTISPALLEQLQATPMGDNPPPVLSPDMPHPFIAVVPYIESDFRLALNADAMATEKLAEGIRLFAADTEKLEALIQAQA